MDESKMMYTNKERRNQAGIFKLKIHILTLLILSGALLSRGQENESEQLRNQWEQYSQRIVQEKLYAHIDRNFYSAGEIIWFKLYDLDAIQHKPIDISKVAMVELIAKDGKAVMQAKISMKDGFGNGSLLVPFSLNSGNYLFRAYTNWMKNFPADYYFEKQITILNSQRKPLWDSAANKMTYDIQFFPEGGNLVYGFQSKVGFRNVDQFGRGADCNGVVVDQKNDTVARFQSLKFGLGQFLFEPVKGETYNALIRTKDGQLIKKMLPTPFDNGYVLRLTEPDTGHLLVSVRSNVTMMAPAVYLFVQSNQVIKAILQSDLKDGKAEFLLDRKMLGEGISQLTLFNANRQPVCERLFFRKPAHPLNIEIRSGKEEYDLRQKVSLDVQTNDHSGPAAGELSVAVYLQDSLQSQGSMDINGWLWLVSDLRGNIESPDFYLNNSGADVKEATENLLLTQGWRRYRWEEILNKRQPQLDYVPEYDGQIINARIIERRTGAPVPNTPVYLSIPGEKFRLNIATSNQKGSFDSKSNGFTVRENWYCRQMAGLTAYTGLTS